MEETKKLCRENLTLNLQVEVKKPLQKHVLSWCFRRSWVTFSPDFILLSSGHFSPPNGFPADTNKFQPTFECCWKKSVLLQKKFESDYSKCNSSESLRKLVLMFHWLLTKIYFSKRVKVWSHFPAANTTRLTYCRTYIILQWECAVYS